MSVSSSQAPSFIGSDGMGRSALTSQASSFIGSDGMGHSALTSQASSFIGSDGMGRSGSTSPQSSVHCGSASDASSISSSPTRQTRSGENQSCRGGGSGGGRAQSAPSRQNPNFNNGSRGGFDDSGLNQGSRGGFEDASVYDRDFNFIHGSGRPQSVLGAVGGNPATWNHTELVQALLQSNDVLITWMKEMNLLVKNWSCPKCTSPMAWETIPLVGTKTMDRYQWRCPRRSCALTIHLRSSSFFDRPFYVTLASFVEIIYWWAKGAPMAFVVEETGCGMEFLGYAFCLIREVCGLMVNDFVVGGPGAVTGYTDSLKLTINGMVCESYLGTMQESEKKWRRKHGSQPFLNILEHIAIVYDLGGLQNFRGQTDSQRPAGRGNTMEWRANNRGDRRSLNDSFKTAKTKGSFPNAGDSQTQWKTDSPSLWQTSDPFANSCHSFHETIAQDTKTRRS